jgi:TonB-dependent receptor
VKSKSRTNRSSLEQLNKLGLLGTTALIASFGFAPMAYAQDDTTQTEVMNELDDEDTMIVSGIRQSLKTARDFKRNADTAVDSITASDVSTLPDLSVAEALARVPGVVVQRFDITSANGGDFPSPEGGGNLIRGLTLVRSELNGRDSFSANGGRALDFGTIPPELIGAVDVYKNTSADLIEGGIGGSINLRTLEPFDREGLIAVATIDGVYTDLRDEISPDYSFILGNRFDTGAGEFGLLGSFSSSELKSDLHGFQIGQLIPFSAPNGETIAIPNGYQLRTNEVDRERDAYYVAGQWRSNDGNIEATAKYALIENEVNSDERTLEYFGDGESFGAFSFVGDQFSVAPFSSAGIAQCNGSNDPGNGTDDPVCERTRAVTGIYEEGIISNALRDWTGARGANGSNLGINQVDKSQTDDLSLNVKWRPSDRLFVSVDGHRTTAEFTRQRLWGGSRFFADYAIRADLDNPSVTLITDPTSDPFGGGFGRGPNPGAATGTADPRNSYLLFAADEFADNEGDLWAVRGDVEYEIDSDGWFDAVKFGARYSDRDQTNRAAGLNWAAVAPPWAGGYLPYSNLDQSAFTEFGGQSYELVDYTDFFRGGVVNGSNTEVVFVNRGLLQDYDAFASVIANDPLISGDGFNPDWQPLRNTEGVVDYAGRGQIGDVREQTQNFYGRLDFGNEFDNGMSVEGNFGVRYTSSEVSGDGSFAFNSLLSLGAQNGGTDLTDGDERLLNFIPEAVAYSEQADILRSGRISKDDRWLPSFNIKWNVNDELLFRFAASEAITRPRIDQLRSDQSAGVSNLFIVTDDPTVPVDERVIDIQTQQINVNGGNPNLKPIESTNLDLALEYYFGDNNTFTATGFYKDVRNNIIFGSQTVDTVTLDGNEVAIVFNGDVNQDKAEILGFELAYQQFFDELPGLLSNFGVQANYTFIDAKTNAPVPFVDADGDGAPDNFDQIFRFGADDFLGLSDHTANLIGIYQDDSVEVRLAYNWRSEYLSSYRDFVSGNPIYQTDRGYLDGSAKWDISENLQARFQVANILDTRANAEQQIDAAGQRFGRTSFIGDRRIKVGLRFQY